MRTTFEIDDPAGVAASDQALTSAIENLKTADSFVVLTLKGTNVKDITAACKLVDRSGLGYAFWAIQLDNMAERLATLGLFAALGVSMDDLLAAEQEGSDDDDS